jgi:hypothetical protein
MGEVICGVDVQTMKCRWQYRVWGMVYGCMEYGVWSMVYGVWCMEYGVWSMEYGVWSINGLPERTRAALQDRLTLSPS